MIHYICEGGCKGYSEVPGECQDTTCENYELPLKKCDCTDDEHYGAFGSEPEKK